MKLDFGCLWERESVCVCECACAKCCSEQRGKYSKCVKLDCGPLFLLNTRSWQRRKGREQRQMESQREKCVNRSMINQVNLWPVAAFWFSQGKVSDFDTYKRTVMLYIQNRSRIINVAGSYTTNACYEWIHSRADFHLRSGTTRFTRLTCGEP